MSSHVFKPGRTEFSFELEKKDGKKLTLQVQSNTSAEMEELGQMKDISQLQREELSVRKQLAQNAEKTVDEVIKYIKENGDLIQFAIFLAATVQEIRAGK